MGCGLHALDHVRSDALAHHRMPHDCPACKRREGILSFRNDRLVASDMVFDIYAGHAAAAATAGDLSNIQAVPFEELFHSRAQF